MKTSATAKYVGTSARKTGLVAALIRGRSAIDARTILRVTDKRATVPIGKVLESAIANAENNYSAKLSNLMIESVLIGPGPSLKRSRPRAKGSASAILKRSSHITIVLSDVLPPVKKLAAHKPSSVKPGNSDKAVKAVKTGGSTNSVQAKRADNNPEEAA